MSKWPWDTFKATHRCEGSLNAGVPIRYRPENHYNSKSPYAWILCVIEWDSEWGTYHHNRVTKIDFCPFCGQRLVDPPEAATLPERLALFKRWKAYGLSASSFCNYTKWRKEYATLPVCKA